MEIKKICTWQTQEWKDKTAEFVKGKVCAWCGTDKNLMPHHPRKKEIMNKKLTKLIHLFGKSCLVVFAGNTVWMFYRIQTQGVFEAIENNLVIRYVEVGMSIFGFAYALYLWFNQQMKEVS